MEEDEKLCLAAVILTEAFLMTPHSSEKIPSSRLQYASDFEAYTSLAWGKEAYNVLSTSIKRMDTNTWARGQYEVKGFPLALLIWSFSAVPLFGATFAVCNDTSKCVYPLYSNWESSLTPRLDQIVDAIQASDCIEVKSIIGDPEEYKHLVEETHVDDKEFEDIVHLVMRGYRLKEIDWRNKIVEYISAEAELGQQLSDSAKLDKILKLVADFNRRLEILEVALKVRDNMGTYNESELEGDKDKSEEHAGQSNPHEDTGKEDRVFDENVNSTFEDSFRQANTQDGSYAGDDENTEKSGNSDNAEEGTPRDKSNTPSHSTPKFNLFSQESQGSGKDKKNSQQKAGSSKKKVVREKKQKKCKEGDNAEENVSERKEQKKRKTSDNQDVDDTTKAMPRRKKNKADNVGEVKRKSERNHAPSIHTQWPYTAEKKRHPIVHPFEKVDTTRVDLLAKWKSSRKTKPLTILGNKVDAKWFTTLETPGKSIKAAHIDAAVQLYKQRQENHPDIYVNKDVTLVDSKFIQAIDDSYDIFLDDKDGFDFDDECFSKVFKEKRTKVIFAPMCVEQRLWIPLEINLASRSIQIWDNGSSFFCDKKKQKQVEAYARSMPYIAQKKFPMVERNDDSPFNSSPFRVIHLSCFTQLKKIEDSGVYMVKIMESYAMSRRTNDEFHEHSIADIRKKLAVDIFAELGNS